MSGDPINPQPPIAEPGKRLPQNENDSPGHSNHQPEVDPEPLHPVYGDDLV